ISKAGGSACTPVLSCESKKGGGAGTGDRGRRLATSLARETTVHRTPYGGTDVAVPEHSGLPDGQASG
ncbi:MAG: hypothetical protein ACYS9C_14945, partial [Planctomycetota bacterium]